MPELKPSIPATSQRVDVAVGLGASAGGLTALEGFFSHLPPFSGLTFFVVQHLDPRGPSLLTELLSRHARIIVCDAADGLVIEPDHAYVCPPHCLLKLEGDTIRLGRCDDTHSRNPVDALFGSLAVTHGQGAVGIVLSGTGSDGTDGLRKIRARGGLAIAQSPEAAQYDGMPLSAIVAGVVDLVLPVEAMPDHILAEVRDIATLRAAPAGTDIRAQVPTVLSTLQRLAGYDFSRYKTSTLSRRILRRVRILGLPSVMEYVQRLETDPEEPGQLFKDLLIGVTRFFRDPEAFDALAARVLPMLLEGRPIETPLRIWVAGCASGEEAYSIAILMLERLGTVEEARRVQIFATDIDASAIATARAGRFQEEVLENLSDERRERFFAREGDGFQVIREVRDLCVFSVHNLVRDPPFSSIDLISCRNVLIYFQSDLQARVLALFHYALRPGGFLFLGPAGGLVGRSDLFEVIDTRQRIFRRKDGSIRQLLMPSPLHHQRTVPPLASPPPAPLLPQATKQAFERMLLEDYVPASAVVNEHGEIQLVAGPIGRFLQPAPGALSNNLLDLARGPLRGELRTALSHAVRHGRCVMRKDVLFDGGEELRRLSLAVRPLVTLAAEGGLYAVILRDTAPAAPEAAEGAAEEEGELADRPLVDRLETELRATRAELQSTVFSLEAANEELRASNEELISINEELQSANEELQSSQEELQASQEEVQSANEGMAAANAELHRTVDELATANSDLANLFASTQVATIFLDRALRVTRFTPAATALFRLIDADVGRPITDLAPRFVGADMIADAREVLATENTVERQVRTADGSWFIVRSRPYRTLEGAMGGVVSTFLDVSELKRAEASLRQFTGLVRMSPDAILVRRLDGTIESWNRGAEDLYGYSAAEAEGRPIQELLGTVFPRPWPEVLEALWTGGAWQGDLLQHTRTGREVLVDGRFQIAEGDDGIIRILEINRDITAERQAEEARRTSEQRYRSLFDAMSEGMQVCELLQDEEGRPIDYLIIDANPAFEANTGLHREQVVGRRRSEVTPGIERSWLERFGQVVSSGDSVRFEEYNASYRRWFHVIAYALPQTNRFAVIFQDVTQRRQAVKDAEHRTAERFRVALARSRISVSNQDRDLRFTWIEHPHHTSPRSRKYWERPMPTCCRRRTRHR